MPLDTLKGWHGSKYMYEFDPKYFRESRAAYVGMHPARTPSMLPLNDKSAFHQPNRVQEGQRLIDAGMKGGRFRIRHTQVEKKCLKQPLRGDQVGNFCHMVNFATGSWHMR